MIDPKNILIFPAGTEIAFEIFNALKYSKFVKLYGGTSVSDHSEFVYKNIIMGFPYVSEEGFLEFLNDVIEKYRIDAVYPAHDSVCMYMSENISVINAQVIVTEYKTVKICRSKAETYKYLAEEDFIPKTFVNFLDIKEYPIFVKPDIGQGSNGVKRIDSAEELTKDIADNQKNIICEYLPGMEYTIDCFTDRYRKLRVIKFRDRQRIRAGISVRSEILHMDKGIEKIANCLNKKFAFRGAWFFQVKKNAKGEYRLMEVSPRIPGTMGLSRNLGINFPLLTLFDFWGFDIDIIDNDIDIKLDRAFYSAYKIRCEFEHIYLDFDDTLIVFDKVNIMLLAFLYQSIEQGKKIHLLSKHAKNIYESLRKYKISEDLFDEIVIIKPQDEKYRYISKFPAIFIDDSFAERIKVQRILSIPVFDVDMVESLISWAV